MSFSNDIKKELAHLKLTNKLEVLLELSSILKSNASISIRNAFININFITESEHVVQRITNLIEYLYDYTPLVSKLENNSIMRDGVYNLTIESEDVVNKIMAESGFDFLGNYTVELEVLYQRIVSLKDRGISAYLRGVFLGAGSMVDPTKSYLIQIFLNNDQDVALAQMVFDYAKIDTLYKEVKEKKIIYIKNSEMIADYLNIIKANKALLELENVKVEKDLRNNINRRMNFDMANLNKTIETSMETINDIDLLINNKALPKNLEEIAFLRKEYPDLPLKQLGEMMKPSISKSSVAYKLNKLKKLAKKFDK